MATFNYQRFYPFSDFLLLPPGTFNLARFITEVGALALETPPQNISLSSDGLGVLLDWFSASPDEDDVSDLDALVATFVGGGTTSQPFVYQSFAVSTSSSSTPVAKINETTPPLDAGTYQVSWASSLRMQAVIANTGVQADITLTSSGGGSVHQDDAWNLANRHAYNGSQPFEIAAGQTITVLLTFNRLGASGVAEMSGARVTIDKIS